MQLSAASFCSLENPLIHTALRVPLLSGTLKTAQQNNTAKVWKTTPIRPRISNSSFKLNTQQRDRGNFHVSLRVSIQPWNWCIAFAAQFLHFTGTEKAIQQAFLLCLTRCSTDKSVGMPTWKFTEPGHPQPLAMIRYASVHCCDTSYEQYSAFPNIINWSVDRQKDTTRMSYLG